MLNVCRILCLKYILFQKNDISSTWTISLLYNTPTVYSKCVTNAATCTHTHTYYRLFVTKSGSDLYALFMFQNVELCQRSKNSKINTNVIIGWRDVVRKRHTWLQRCCEIHLRKCSRFQTISKVKECLSDSMFEKSVHLTKRWAWTGHRYHHESPQI